MTIASLAAAFGGGVFGALAGAMFSFIFTGMTALIGIAIALSGGGEMFLNEVAFGPFFGPHIGFAGGAAASAYLGRKKRKILEKTKAESYLGTEEVYKHTNERDQKDLRKLVDGEDVTTPLYKSNNSIALLIGGLFGMFGYSLNYLFSEIWAFPMDTVAFVVFISAVITRFTFGSTGFLGRFPKNEPRYDSAKKELLFTTIWSAGLSAVTAYIVLMFDIHTIGFAISAASLIFLYFNVDFPVTHHVTMTAGFAAVTFGNIWIPILFGICAAISGALTERTINTYVDTHIDMPATMIALWSFIILGVFG